MLNILCIAGLACSLAYFSYVQLFDNNFDKILEKILLSLFLVILFGIGIFWSDPNRHPQSKIFIIEGIVESVQSDYNKRETAVKFDNNRHIVFEGIYEEIKQNQHVLISYTQPYDDRGIVQKIEQKG